MAWTYWLIVQGEQMQRVLLDDLVLVAAHRLERLESGCCVERFTSERGELANATPRTVPPLRVATVPASLGNGRQSRTKCRDYCRARIAGNDLSIL